MRYICLIYTIGGELDVKPGVGAGVALLLGLQGELRNKPLPVFGGAKCRWLR